MRLKVIAAFSKVSGAILLKNLDGDLAQTLPYLVINIYFTTEKMYMKNDENVNRN